jgi:hypothetical protein
MASFTAPSSPPIILIPTEHSNAINGPGVIVRNTSKPKRDVSCNEMVYSYLDDIRNEAIALFTFHPSEWLSAFRYNPKFPLFAIGDIDGFVALFMNNLATLLAVILGLKIVFENDIIYGKIVPG